MSNETATVKSGTANFEFIDIYFSMSAAKIWIYGSPPILILGTVGNILSILVMNARSLRASTTSLYLTALAICDLVLLYISLFPIWLQQQFSAPLGTTRGCTLYWVGLYVAVHFEAWVLVRVSIERFVAVWIPTSHRSLFTMKKALIGLIITGVLLLGVDSHFLFTHNDPDNCQLVAKYHTFVYFIFPWVDLTLANLFAFLIMLSTSLAIIVKLLANRKLVANNKTSSMRVILLTVSLTFFLTTLPICIYLILVPILMEGGGTADDEFHLYSDMWAIHVILVDIV